MAIELHSSFAVHPGDWLRTEIIEPLGLNATKAAERLHVGRKTMRNLLQGKSRLSAVMAIRFEKVFGITADSLMRMRVAHELRHSRLHEDEIAAELAVHD